jgi:hypothetical protein
MSGGAGGQVSVFPGFALLFLITDLCKQYLSFQIYLKENNVFPLQRLIG